MCFAKVPLLLPCSRSGATVWSLQSVRQLVLLEVTCYREVLPAGEASVSFLLSVVHLTLDPLPHVVWYQNIYFEISCFMQRCHGSLTTYILFDIPRVNGLRLLIMLEPECTYKYFYSKTDCRQYTVGYNHGVGSHISQQTQ